MINMNKIDEAVMYLEESGVTFCKNEIFSSIQDDFLKRYGLPQLNNVFIIDDLCFFYEPKLKTTPSEYLAIGCDGLGLICINLSTNEVVSLDSNLSECYMNNDFSEFIYFVYLYKKMFLDQVVEDEETEFKIFKRLKKNFNEINPKSLMKDTNWWSEIIEPLEFGLL